MVLICFEISEMLPFLGSSHWLALSFIDISVTLSPSTNSDLSSFVESDLLKPPALKPSCWLPCLVMKETNPKPPDNSPVCPLPQVSWRKAGLKGHSSDPLGDEILSAQLFLLLNCEVIPEVLLMGCFLPSDDLALFWKVNQHFDSETYLAQQWVWICSEVILRPVSDGPHSPVWGAGGRSCLGSWPHLQLPWFVCCWPRQILVHLMTGGITRIALRGRDYSRHMENLTVFTLGIYISTDQRTRKNKIMSS